MNILDKIIAQKHTEVAAAKVLRPVELLKTTSGFHRETHSLKQFLIDPVKTGIIAEFKRKSPSKGLINGHSTVAEVTNAYTLNGASALSILTDEHFFGGNTADIDQARGNSIPILRKDFIIDEYQLIEARAIGADVILLIAACLTPQKVKELASFAKSIQLEVLLEIHNEDELQHICKETEIVGVNNRDLKTFSVDLDRSISLCKQIPEGKLTVAESGINDSRTIGFLKEHGFNGFLIGEHFMKENDPGKAFEIFVNNLK